MPSAPLRAVLAALVALAAGCAAPGGEPAATRLPHVHGLAFDPADPSVLLAATHEGLFRSSDGASWTRVGGRDDLMGFLVHPSEPGTYYSSGHPPAGGNLGLRVSRDGGATWSRVALEGHDLHAMALTRVEPDRMWAASQGALMRSDDGGRTWAPVAAPAPVAALAAHALEKDRLYAATTDGVRATRDAGATWDRVLDASVASLAFDAHRPGVGYAAVRDDVLRTEDDGASWRPLRVPFGAERPTVLGLHPHDHATLLVATAAGAVHRTTDAGATWTTLLAPTR